MVNAVLAAGSDDVRDAIARAEALTAVRGSEDFAAVSAAFKRIKNIFAGGRENIDIGSADREKLAPEAQPAFRCRRLPGTARCKAAAGARLRSRVERNRHPAPHRRYSSSTRSWCSIPIETVRGANLALIDEVLRRFSGIADFSEIVTG